MKNSKEGIKIVVPKRDTDLAIENITNSNNAISKALLFLASTNKALADSLSATNYHVSIEGCVITNTSDTGIGIDLKGTDSPETETLDFDDLFDDLFYDEEYEEYDNEEECCNTSSTNVRRRNKPRPKFVSPSSKIGDNRSFKRY